jgi:aminomethyltransferase
MHRLLHSLTITPKMPPTHTSLNAPTKNDSGKLKPITRKRVGLAGFKAPARAHTEIYDPSGATKLGEVTSGTFSPSLNKPIAMGYVAKDFAAEGSKVAVKVRGKLQEAEVVKMPFVPQRYYKPE